MSDHYECGRCKGTGRIELTGVYAQTLELLRQQPQEEVTATGLASLAGCNATTMNNRLDSLERLGLLSSRPDGRRRLFRSIKTRGQS